MTQLHTNPQPDLEIKVVTNAAERQTVYALREAVFIQELGYKIVGSLHEQGIIAAAHANGFSLLAIQDGTPAGTMALDWWQGCDLDHPDVDQYQFQLFSSYFSAAHIATVRKLLVLKEYRSTHIYHQLLQLAAARLQPQVRLIFIDCVAAREAHFRRLGFRRYAPHFVYSTGGEACIPLCLALNDFEHLSQMHSPLLSLLQKFGRRDDPDDRAVLTPIFQQWNRYKQVSQVA